MLHVLIRLILLLKRFYALKVEVEKLDITKFVNVPTSLNNLKTKVGDLDVGQLNTGPMDLKNLSELKKLIQNTKLKIINTKFKTLKTKVNNLEKKISDATALIHINQYNTDKQNLEKIIGDVDKKNQIRVV